MKTNQLTAVLCVAITLTVAAPVLAQHEFLDPGRSRFLVGVQTLTLDNSAGGRLHGGVFGVSLGDRGDLAMSFAVPEVDNSDPQFGVGLRFFAVPREIERPIGIFAQASATISEVGQAYQFGGGMVANVRVAPSFSIVPGFSLTDGFIEVSGRSWISNEISSTLSLDLEFRLKERASLVFDMAWITGTPDAFALGLGVVVALSGSGLGARTPSRSRI